MTWTSWTHARRSPSPSTTKPERCIEKALIPFWEGKSMRDLILSEMTDEWHAAYEAGIFTEFMEQRSPGHTVLDDKIYSKGILDFKADIQRSLDSLDFVNDPRAYDKQEELKAMAITADAMIRYAERHAEKADELAAGRTSDPQRKAELRRSPRSVAMCRPTRRAPFTRRSNTTGSSIWASPPN
jgi:hypothetical protein